VSKQEAMCALIHPYGGPRYRVLIANDSLCCERDWGDLTASERTGSTGGYQTKLPNLVCKEVLIRADTKDSPASTTTLPGLMLSHEVMKAMSARYRIWVL
jgi:hypothetical protein